jgi:hypothetical protein
MDKSIIEENNTTTGNGNPYKKELEYLIQKQTQNNSSNEAEAYGVKIYFRAVGIKEAAAATNLTEGQIRIGIKEGKYPFEIVGAGRGKYILDIDLLIEVLENSMKQNMAMKNKREDDDYGKY